MKRSICALAFLTGLISFPMAGIIHVPADQPSIQAGINAAANGDTVLVADSTYYENIHFMGKAITVASYFLLDSDSVHIDSTIINGSQPSNPDKGSVVSFVSGEDTTSVLCGFTITGGTGSLYEDWLKVGGGICIFSSGARISHNKIIFNSVTHSQIPIGGGIGVFPKTNSKNVIIDENVIAYNSLNGTTGGSGGGIFLVKGRISNNKIFKNTSKGKPNAFGGGISINCDTTYARTFVNIAGNTIMNNEATSDNPNGGGIGGGIDVQFSQVHIFGNQITHNNVSGANPEGGAGIRLVLTGPSIVKDNNISFNSSLSQISGLWGLGGGLGAWRTVDLIIQENQFEGNESIGGGGIYEGQTVGNIISSNEFYDNYAEFGAGGIFDQGTSGTVISGNKFIGNETNTFWSAGGGMVCYLSNEITITGNLFKQNSAYQCGGLASQNSDLLLTNNIFTGNEAHTGGAIGTTYNPPNMTITNKIINNTITGNVADTAGGIWLGDSLGGSNVILMNNICWGNSAAFAPEIFVQGGTTEIAHSDIRFGVDSIEVTNGGTLNWLANNIDDDPLLVVDSLSNNSPCISAGIDVYNFGSSIIGNSPSEDINGRARPYPAGSNPDMGAWESKQGLPVGVESQSRTGIPKKYVLKQNYPNPFNPSTMISYQIPITNYVELSVYNLLGQKLVTLVSEKQQAGSYQVELEASQFSSGVYYYRIEAGDFQDVKKMVLLK
jgi:hypothetical protein